MTNSRSLIWLIAVLLLTASAHLALHYKGGMRQALVQRTHLLSVPTDRVVALSLSRPGRPAIEISRDRRWRMKEPYAAVVDEKTILKSLDILAASEIVASTGEQELLRLGRTREDFGLSRPEMTVVVADADSKMEISFGSLTPSGDGRYASVAGEDAIYVVSTNAFAAMNLPPEGFLRRAVFSVAQEAVLALDMKRGSGSFMRFARDGELWRMTQPREVQASATRVKSLLESVLSASAVDFVWPSGATNESAVATTAFLAGYGLDPESAVTLTMKCADGINRQISFGKEASGGLVYALILNGTAIVTLPGALKDAARADISEFTDTRLFPLAASAIAGVSVSESGTTYLLSRAKSGAWLLESPVAAATDPSGVSELLERIGNLDLGDLATNGVTVAVTPGDKPLTVRREALLDGFRLEGLRSREIVRIDPSVVRRLVVTPAEPGRPTAVVYDFDRRAWKVESSERSGTVSEKDVAALLGALDPLRAEWVVKLKVTAADLRTYGLDRPWLTVAIDFRKDDAVRRNVLIGGETPGGRYATVGSADAVFVLPYDIVHRLSSPLVK